MEFEWLILPGLLCGFYILYNSLLGSYFIICARPLANERAWHARYSGYRGQWGHGRCHTHHWSRGDIGQHSGIPPPPPTLSRTKYSASYPASLEAPKIQIIIHFLFQIQHLIYPDRNIGLGLLGSTLTHRGLDFGSTLSCPAQAHMNGLHFPWMELDWMEQLSSFSQIGHIVL